MTPRELFEKLHDYIVVNPHDPERDAPYLDVEAEKVIAEAMRTDMNAPGRDWRALTERAWRFIVEQERLNHGASCPGRRGHSGLCGCNGGARMGDFFDIMGDLYSALHDPPPTERPPAACVQCGRDVEPLRRCYAHPTCYACLPPPEPLTVVAPSADSRVCLGCGHFKHSNTCGCGCTMYPVESPVSIFDVIEVQHGRAAREQAEAEARAYVEAHRPTPPCDVSSSTHPKEPK